MSGKVVVGTSIQLHSVLSYLLFDQTKGSPSRVDILDMPGTLGQQHLEPGP